MPTAPIEVPSIVKNSKPETKLAKMRAVNPDIPVVDLIDRLRVEEKITDKQAAKLREANAAEPVDPIAVVEPAEGEDGPADSNGYDTPDDPESASTDEGYEEQIHDAAVAAAEPSDVHPPAPAEKQPRAGSAMDGALQILKEAHEPLRPADIITEMTKRGLATSLQGKTPEATLAAQLCVAMKNQKYGLHRPERGKYAIKP